MFAHAEVNGHTLVYEVIPLLTVLKHWILKKSVRVGTMDALKSLVGGGSDPAPHHIEVCVVHRRVS